MMSMSNVIDGRYVNVIKDVYTSNTAYEWRHTTDGETPNNDIVKEGNDSFVSID